MKEGVKRKPALVDKKAREQPRDALSIAYEVERRQRETERALTMTREDLQIRVKALEDSPDTKKLENEIHQLGVLIFEAANVGRRFLKERVPQ